MEDPLNPPDLTIPAHRARGEIGWTPTVIDLTDRP